MHSITEILHSITQQRMGSHHWTSEPRVSARWHPAELNPFGVIPKFNQPGRWCLIVDLLSPEGRSVNDGSEADLCSLNYLRQDQVVFCSEMDQSSHNISLESEQPMQMQAREVHMSL